MKAVRFIFENLLLTLTVFLVFSCQPMNQPDNASTDKTAKDILGNTNYQAISYGGYRKSSRDIQPTVVQLKEDMKILAAMDIKLLRTYNTKLAQASNLLKAIHELKTEDSGFEMYVMLGAWIDCAGAFTDEPNHEKEDEEANRSEIARTVALANKYPDIVKIIAVGNEAMVKWAAPYFVQPEVILKYVNYLQKLKTEGKLDKDLWITSSDNFASWGGGEERYHVEALNELIRAVDFISLHTYPMHDTHYNPSFWGVLPAESAKSDMEKIDLTMQRALNYAQKQYENTVNYMNSLGVDKPVHIGETGWASSSNGHYGEEGSRATDELKEGIYYASMREWSNNNNITCFYFEAFDEIWKDAANPGGSENHFGLFTIDGKAKYALWDLVDEGRFDGVSRDGNPIIKTFNGNKNELIQSIAIPRLNTPADIPAE